MQTITEQIIFFSVPVERSPWTTETELQALSYVTKPASCLQHVAMEVFSTFLVILQDLVFWELNSEHLNKDVLVFLTEHKIYGFPLEFGVKVKWQQAGYRERAMNGVQVVSSTWEVFDRGNLSRVSSPGKYHSIKDNSDKIQKMKFASNKDQKSHLRRRETISIDL